MKKTVMKLDLHDDRDKRKALKAVSTLPGVDSIAMDMKEHKLTVVGAVDPVDIVKKLRKAWQAEIISVGAPGKEGGSAAATAGGGGGEKKSNASAEQTAELLRIYQGNLYPPPYIPNQYHYFRNVDEEPPNSCVIS